MTLLRLNLRRGESTIRFAKQPEWLDTLGNPLSDAAVDFYIRGRRVLALVHGYNVTEAMDAYALIANMVSANYDTVIGVTWPGSKIALAFWFAEMRANKAGRMLAAGLLPHLADINSDNGRFDMEAHSLGCRVALESLRSGLEIRNLILAAAAVHDESVEVGELYGSVIEGRTQRTLVAYSSKDPVLRRAFKIAEWDNALGLTGPRSDKSVMLPTTLEAIDFSSVIKEHSGYKRSAEFYNVWEQTVKISV